MEIPGPIEELCEALLDGLKSILSEMLYAIYLYGAAVDPEGGATGDIDFHVILKHKPSEEEKAQIKHLYADLGRDYPPMGSELDGYFILEEDAKGTEPPKHQLVDGIIDHSWALHRAHILAGRCVVLYGPEPREILQPAAWPELEIGLLGELDYVRRHLSDYPAYCTLNLCRILYSFNTHNVVISKRFSAKWASAAIPTWNSLIDAALKTYDRQASESDQLLLVSETPEFYDYVNRRIHTGEC